MAAPSSFELAQQRDLIHHGLGNVMRIVERLRSGETIDTEATIRTTIVALENALSDFCGIAGDIAEGRTTLGSGTPATLQGALLVALTQAHRRKTALRSGTAHEAGFHSPEAA